MAIMKAEYCFCQCGKVINSYAVVSDVGCWEVCHLCKRVIKESLELYDSYVKKDEKDFAKQIYELGVARDKDLF